MTIKYYGTMYHAGVLGMRWGHRKQPQLLLANPDHGESYSRKSDYSRYSSYKNRKETVIDAKFEPRDKTQTKAQTKAEKKQAKQKTREEASKSKPESEASKPNNAEDAARNFADAKKNHDKLLSQVGSAKTVVDTLSKSYKPVGKPQDLSFATNEDLTKVIRRMELEKKYRELNPPQLSKGQKALRTTLSVAGGVLATATSALTIAAAIRELRK